MNTHNKRMLVPTLAISVFAAMPTMVHCMGIPGLGSASVLPSIATLRASLGNTLGAVRASLSKKLGAASVKSAVATASTGSAVAHVMQPKKVFLGLSVSKSLLGFGGAIAGGLAVHSLYKYYVQCRDRKLFLNSLKEKYCKDIDPILGFDGNVCDQLAQWRICHFKFAQLFWPQFQDLLTNDNAAAIIDALKGDVATRHFGYRLHIADAQGYKIENPTWQNFFDMLEREKAQVREDKKKLETWWPDSGKEYFEQCNMLGVRPDTPRWTAEHAKQIEECMKKAGARLQASQMWWFLAQAYWRLLGLEKVVREFLIDTACATHQTPEQILNTPIVVAQSVIADSVVRVASASSAASEVRPVRDENSRKHAGAPAAGSAAAAGVPADLSETV